MRHFTPVCLEPDKIEMADMGHWDKQHLTRYQKRQVSSFTRQSILRSDSLAYFDVALARNQLEHRKLEKMDRQRLATKE